jgi:hypothetical protein
MGRRITSLLWNDRERLAAAYREGAFISDLARAYRCSEVPVRNVLRSAGVALRPRRARSLEERRTSRAVAISHYPELAEPSSRALIARRKH